MMRLAKTSLTVIKTLQTKRLSGFKAIVYFLYLCGLPARMEYCGRSFGVKGHRCYGISQRLERGTLFSLSYIMLVRFDDNISGFTLLQPQFDIRILHCLVYLWLELTNHCSSFFWWRDCDDRQSAFPCYLDTSSMDIMTRESMYVYI